MKFLTLALITLLPFPLIELEKRTFLHGWVELLVPKTFKEMSKEEIKTEYKLGDKPAFVLKNDSGTIKLDLYYYADRYFGVKLIPNEEASLILAKSAFKAGVEEASPGLTWEEEETKDINGRKVWYAKIIHSADGEKLFQYTFMTCVQKRFFIGNFLCPGNVQPEWEETADRIVNSFKVK